MCYRALRLYNCNLKRLSLYVRHVDELFFQVNKVPDHLMCNLKRSGAFTEKPDFENLTVLSMEIPYEFVCHVSFEIMGIFIRYS